MKRECLFKVLTLLRYDVVIPFICYQCGNCCRNYFPNIFRDQLPKITKILNMTQQAIENRLLEDFDAHNAGRTKDCMFLDQKSCKCLIHKIKPESCRDYPLRTDLYAGHVDCPGYKEFKNVYHEFFKRRRFAALYDPSYHRKKIQYIPDYEWPKVLRKLERAQASDALMHRFIEMNKGKMAT